MALHDGTNNRARGRGTPGKVQAHLIQFWTFFLFFFIHLIGVENKKIIILMTAVMDIERQAFEEFYIILSFLPPFLPPTAFFLLSLCLRDSGWVGGWSRQSAVEHS